MAYLADPGGVFASDTHRRVLGHLPLPTNEPVALFNDEGTPRQQRRNSLFHRVADDVHTPVDTQEELAAVLAELEASGYVTQTDAGWVMTQEGLVAITSEVVVNG